MSFIFYFSPFGFFFFFFFSLFGFFFFFFPLLFKLFYLLFWFVVCLFIYCRFFLAPTAGSGAACRSCAHCPWMAMNGLENTLAVLEDDNGCGQEIFVDPALAAKAMKPLDRMLEFGARLKP